MVSEGGWIEGKSIFVDRGMVHFFRDRTVQGAGMFACALQGRSVRVASHAPQGSVAVVDGSLRQGFQQVAREGKAGARGRKAHVL